MDRQDRDDTDDEEDTDRRRRPTAAELRHHRRTVPGGIAVVADLEPEPAEPPELEVPWPAVPDRHDAEALRRSGRDPADPVRPAEVSAIVRQLARKLRDEFSVLLADAPRDIAAAVNERLDKFEARLAPLERDFEPHRRFAKWVAGIAGAALLAVGVFLYHRGADEQRVTDKLQQLERDIWRVEHPHEPPQTGP